MTTIILVRHGQNDWVSKHRLAGWIEGVHLNEVGQQQAKDAAKRLANLPFKAIYSSPVLRCMETATHLAEPHKLPIEQLPEIGEVRYGEWEGKKIKKLAKKKEWFAVQHYPSRFQFPEGESLRGVQSRAIDKLEQLAAKHPKDYIMVVSHADLIKLVLAHYMGVHMDLFQRIVISPASASVVQLHENGVVRVIRVNDDGLLQPPSPPKEDSANKEKEKSEKKA